MTFNQLLTKYRKMAGSKVHLGNKFERIIKWYLKTEPIYQAKFETIWLWNKFPGRKSISGKDIGIDLVAQTFTGEYWAIQCKCYYSENKISKNDVDTFLSTSGMDFTIQDQKKIKFAHRLFVATTNNWTVHAEQVIQNQHPPVTRIALNNLEDSKVDWGAIESEGEITRKSLSQKKLRPYQNEAVERAISHYQKNDRGKLIMACGTGKTYTALKIAEKLTNNQGFILVLVPSISLVGQLMLEWYIDAEKIINGVAVCSDQTAGRLDNDILKDSLIDLPIDATTDADKVIAELNANKKKGGLKIIFSTYQSIAVVQKIQQHFQKTNPQYGEFDLIICDEAHRTAGVKYNNKKEQSYFTAVHDNNYIAAKKRLYMTATPKLYSENVKSKAIKIQAKLWSMDDPIHFGEEFYRVTFNAAVEQDYLVDYKVIILTIKEDKLPKHVLESIKKQYKNKNEIYEVDEILRLAGVYNAVSKNFFHTNENSNLEKDPTPIRRAVAYCSSLKKAELTSDNIDYLSEKFDTMGITKEDKLQWIDADFIKGTMSSSVRAGKLSWLKSKNFVRKNETRIITNVRCLSEGVNVPSLDAVIFLSERNSYIDIVQSIGRVMRTAPGKKYGYIIIPVVISNSADPKKAMDGATNFKTVWAVLNALRAHDENLENEIQKLSINKKWPSKLILADSGGFGSKKVDWDFDSTNNTLTSSQLEEFKLLKNLIRGKIIDRVGNRRYWENWAESVGKVANKQINTINTLIKQSENSKLIFNKFLKALQGTINPEITQDEGVEMLAQHMITKPIFQELFEDYDFTALNPVSIAMEKVLSNLESNAGLEHTKELSKFYEVTRAKIKGIDNAEGRQKLIIELYEKFFKKAFSKMTGKLGIVYTPIQIVDFILHSVNDISLREFGKSLNDKGVQILDPFTGTGSFISRLLQSGLIQKKNLAYKYKNEIWANEIVPLAYYIAAINIENVYHQLMGGKEYVPFNGICLTDTFHLEKSKGFDDLSPKNSARIKKQKNSSIQIIMGNPPYSVGQKSANDNAKNTEHKELEKRIKETYIKNAPVHIGKQSLYDSFYKAFRWSTDRLSTEGIICFASNGAWLDSLSGAGFRKTIEQEFSTIYVFNLRGNKRTSGETWQKEQGNVFGQGSRTPITITLLVKNKNAKQKKAIIYYHDIGDYLKQEKKLQIIQKVKTFKSDLFKQIIKPNKNNDWINQRENFPENFILLSNSKSKQIKQSTFFDIQSLGVKTNRDSWIYNNSKMKLEKNIRKMIEVYKSEKERFHLRSDKSITLDNFLINDHLKIKWDEKLKKILKNNQQINFDITALRIGLYRPFNKMNIYFNKELNASMGKLYQLFPNLDSNNLIICLQGRGDYKKFSCLLSNFLSNHHLLSTARCFPLYLDLTDNKQKQKQFGFNKNEKEAISNFILNQAKNLYVKQPSKKDIFYYVYGFLHSPEYRNNFKNTLQKSEPKIPLLKNEKHFWAFSIAGGKLADLHLNFENQPPPKAVKLDIKKKNYWVEKMKFINNKNKSVIIYNNQITVSNIPLQAYNYHVNGKSAIEWVMDQQRIRIDKLSGIVNDPNDWATEIGNPRYILDLLLSVISVSLETMKIIDGLPKIDFSKTN